MDVDRHAKLLVLLVDRYEDAEAIRKKDVEARLRALEKFRNRVYGYAAALSASVSATTQKAMHLFS